MKKIALLMDGWKQYITYAWPSGILQRIGETGEDIELYIFNSFGNWSKDEIYNEGEYNIFQLPDFRDYDGIILDLNNIANPAIVRKLQDMARQSGRPVVSLNDDIEGFYFAGIDNYAAMQEIMGHLTQVHGCKSFWFVMGGTNNYENGQRLKGIQDYLAEHQMTYTQREFYYGDYSYQCGYYGFRELKELHDGIPQAIVCANDNIAVGVCEAAREAGYQVPGDFLVTGFDNFDKARYFSPSITTVGQIREATGYQCVDIFRKIWAGEAVEHFHYADVRTIYLESCGCNSDVNLEQSVFLSDWKPNNREYAKGQILAGIESDRFHEEILELQYALLECDSYDKMLKCIPQSIQSVKYEDMYLMLDGNLQDNWGKPLIRESRNDFYTKGYPQSMKIPVDNSFFAQRGSGIHYLFLPLHFRKLTVGYLVLRNSAELMSKQYIFQILYTLMCAMESLYNRKKLEEMNAILEEMNIRDSATMLYNRVGYHRLGAAMLEECRKKKQKMLVLFMDLDKLKYINDQFGHEKGDYAIKAAAAALSSHATKEGIPIRLGGDEFLLLDKAESEKAVEEMIDSIRQELREASQREGGLFPISVSVGYVMTGEEPCVSLEDYVREADTRMYREKKCKIRE